MIVYLINRLKEKQVLTRTNLFCAAEAEDRLARSVDVLALSTCYEETAVHACVYFLIFLHVLCMLSISSGSLFVIIFIKADINNTGGETQRDWQTEMDE